MVQIDRVAELADQDGGAAGEHRAHGLDAPAEHGCVEKRKQGHALQRVADRFAEPLVAHEQAQQQQAERGSDGDVVVQ